MGKHISYRTPTGWKHGFNRNKFTCDLCGKKLWIGSGDLIYCNAVHKSKKK